MRRFCRSVELCDDYLRGYYGLKLSTNRLIPLLSNPNSKSGKSTDTASALPSQATVQKLNQLATLKLGDILRRSKGDQKTWDGYSEAELIAAKELLDRDSDDVAR
ncbi:Inositol phosphatase SIW14 [Oleoguttula sp. CCFEE 5521]